MIAQHCLKTQGLEVHIDSNCVPIVCENTPHEETFQVHHSPSIGVFKSLSCSLRRGEEVKEDPVQVNQFSAKEVQEQAPPLTTGMKGH